MDKITQEVLLIGKKKINTLEELNQKEDEVKSRIDKLVKERCCFYNKVRRYRKLETKEKIQQDIATLSYEIKELRKEVRLYEGIRKRSDLMKENIHEVKELEKEKSIKSQK